MFDCADWLAFIHCVILLQYEHNSYPGSHLLKNAGTWHWPHDQTNYQIPNENSYNHISLPEYKHKAVHIYIVGKH